MYIKRNNIMVRMRLPCVGFEIIAEPGGIIIKSMVLPLVCIGKSTSCKIFNDKLLNNNIEISWIQLLVNGRMIIFQPYLSNSNYITFRFNNKCMYNISLITN